MTSQTDPSLRGPLDDGRSTSARADSLDLRHGPGEARPVTSALGPNRTAALSYLPALDGLRAISVMLVVISHAGLGHIIPGGLGVIVFFAISGFLLTRQMIAEIEHTRNLAIGSFYLRRFLRLVPPLIFFLVVFNTILGALGVTITVPDVAASVFYMANYYGMFVGFEPESPGPILWSLAVEEHYYLVFPFVMRAFRANVPRLLPCLACGVTAVLLWRAVLYQACSANPLDAICGIADAYRIFHGTDTIIDCILWGAMAAIALEFHTKYVKLFLVNRLAALGAIAVLLLCLLLRDPWFRETVRYSLLAAASAIIILNVLFGSFPVVRHLLSTAIIVLIGRLSYSLYLCHFGVLMIVEVVWDIHGGLHGVTPTTVYFVGSFLFAGASYVLVERPMVRLRRRLGSGAR